MFLLHTAAEIEHALMVQYLYAAYSLADGGFTGAAVPPDAAARTDTWRTTIVSIARQEMGHLLTEQNLLRFLGAPLNLEREDFPFRSELYPFPLELAPLTRTSLARYVAAEMPADPDEPDVAEIVARATDAGGGVRPNRVGTLFDTLVAIFEGEGLLVDADFRPQTATGVQMGELDWFAFDGMIVRTIASRADAIAALHAIGEQGEGTEDPPAQDPPSHFAEFLAIYREFPETEPAATGGAPPAWVPTRDVPTNPTTGGKSVADAAVERNRITHPTALLWARLANVRYRMLLADLAHTLALPGPLDDAAGGSTPRGVLRDWTLEQMRGRIFSGGLRGIAGRLSALPAKASATTGDPAHAALAFELPYTLNLTDDEHGRWRLHAALLDASAELVAALRAAGETGPLLDEIEAIDADARVVVTAQLAV